MKGSAGVSTASCINAEALFTVTVSNGVTSTVGRTATNLFAPPAVTTTSLVTTSKPGAAATTNVGMAQIALVGVAGALFAAI
jgi:hypothetical protein